LWLCQKRLSQGRLAWWPSTPQVSHRLSARELQLLLWNGNPEDAGMAEDWRRVA
jgi:transposase